MLESETPKHLPSPQQKKGLRIGGLLLLLFCPLWFLCAGALYQDAREKEASWVKAPGRVLRLVAETSTGSSTVYHPLFEYATADGRTFRVRSNHGSNPPGYEVGESVPVLYSPEKPDEAVIHSFGSLYFAPLVLAIMGAAQFLLGAFLSYAGRRRPNREQA